MRRVGEAKERYDKEMEWDQYFANIADTVRERSKDPRTKVGAIIVGKAKNIVSTGYNGFPSGVGDFPERWERPTKYDYVAHAERNAVDLAARHGTATDGCTMYLRAFDLPCSECAKTIIQAGIKEVIVSRYDREGSDNSNKWSSSAKISKEMFEESGVEFRFM